MSAIVGVSVIQRRATIERMRTRTEPKIRTSRGSFGVSNQSHCVLARGFWLAPASVFVPVVVKDAPGL